MKAANYARKAGSGQLLGHDTAFGSNPHKSVNKINELQRPKIGSSLFYNGPLNLLGGGSFRWPKEGHLDGKTLTKIRHSEVGGELLIVGDPCERAAPS
jgi:hypothetical protein